MYIPKTFAQDDLPELFQFMHHNNFAILFSMVDGVPFATHLPFMLDEQRGEYGTLIAHMARANPHWKSLEADQEGLIVFSGPHVYVSSSWYAPPTTIPTWSYTAVHVYGKPQVTHEPDALQAMVTRLVHYHDAAITPEQYDISKLGAIVGMEIPITRLEGKYKLSQNKTASDQQRVMDKLESTDDGAAQAVAKMMRQLYSE